MLSCGEACYVLCSLCLFFYAFTPRIRYWTEKLQNLVILYLISSPCRNVVTSYLCAKRCCHHDNVGTRKLNAVRQLCAQNSDRVNSSCRNEWQIRKDFLLPAVKWDSVVVMVNTITVLSIGCLTNSWVKRVVVVRNAPLSPGQSLRCALSD